MTLYELSQIYEESAALLRDRLRLLRKELAAASNPDDIWHLKRRIADLTPMLTQMNELSYAMAHYYDKKGNDADAVPYGFNTVSRPRAIRTRRRSGGDRSQAEINAENNRKHYRKRINIPAGTDLEAVQHLWDEYAGNRNEAGDQ